MAQINKIEEEVEDLKKQLWNLSKNVIPALEEKLGNSGSSGDSSESGETTENENTTGTDNSSEQNNWTTLYDMTNDDAAVNLGYTTGIVPMTGFIDAFPDLAPYTRIKVLCHFETSEDYYEFDISTNEDNFYKIVTSNIAATAFMAYVLMIVIRDEKKKIYFRTSSKILFTDGSSPTVTNLKGNANYYVKKIEAR